MKHVAEIALVLCLLTSLSHAAVGAVEVKRVTEIYHTPVKDLFGGGTTEAKINQPFYPFPADYYSLYCEGVDRWPGFGVSAEYAYSFPPRDSSPAGFSHGRYGAIRDAWVRRYSDGNWYGNDREGVIIGLGPQFTVITRLTNTSSSNQWINICTSHRQQAVTSIYLHVEDYSRFSVSFSSVLGGNYDISPAEYTKFINGEPADVCLRPNGTMACSDTLSVYFIGTILDSPERRVMSVYIGVKDLSYGTRYAPSLGPLWRNQHLPCTVSSVKKTEPGIALVASSSDIGLAQGISSNANPTGLVYLPGTNGWLLLDYADGTEGSGLLVLLSGGSNLAVSTVVSSNALRAAQLSAYPPTNDYSVIESERHFSFPMPREMVQDCLAPPLGSFKSFGDHGALFLSLNRIYVVNITNGALTGITVNVEDNVDAVEPVRGMLDAVWTANGLQICSISNILSTNIATILVCNLTNEITEFATQNGWIDNGEQTNEYAPMQWQVTDLRQLMNGDLLAVLDSAQAESLVYRIRSGSATNILRTAPLLLFGKYVNPRIRTLLPHPSNTNLIYLYLEDRTTGADVNYLEEYDLVSGTSRTIIDGDTFKYYVQQITGQPIDTQFRIAYHGLSFGPDGRIYLAESGFERYGGNLFENATRSVWAIDPTITIPAHPKAPAVKTITDAACGEGQKYIGPGPNLLSQGTARITWQLLQGSTGMTIDASGVVAWPCASSTGSPFTITLQATNAVGDSQQAWQLRVASMSDALDCDAPWWSTGSNGWFPQTAISHDDIAAAQSGVTPTGQTSQLVLEVPGPTPFMFWWKVSSRASYDYLRFLIDGRQTNEISGEVDWQQRQYALPTGVHTVTWAFVRSATSGAGAGGNCGWVDQVAVPEPACFAALCLLLWRTRRRSTVCKRF